jgi:hypothetical protein
MPTGSRVVCASVGRLTLGMHEGRQRVVSPLQPVVHHGRARTQRRGTRLKQAQTQRHEQMTREQWGLPTGGGATGC